MNHTFTVFATTLALVLVAACGKQADEPAPAAAADMAPPTAAAPPASGGMVLPATTESSDARASYMAGWADFENARGNSAHKKFLAATAADPDFAMGHLMAALSATSTESFVANLGKATETKAGATAAEQALINAFESALAADSAGWISALQEVTTLVPDSPRAWVFLGNALTNVNNAAESRAAYAKAIELDPKFVLAHVNLGNNYLTIEPKDFAAAEDHIQHAIDLTPEEPNPYDLMGDVHRAQGNLEAAYDDYTRAAELAPELGSGYQQRGHVNSFLGNYEEARADYTRSAELEDARGTSAGGFFLVFRAYVGLHEGDFDAAMAELREIADTADEKYPNSAADLKANALTSLALVATEAGDADAANAAIDDAAAVLRQQAEAVDSDDLRSAAEATISYMQGRLAARLGDTEGAAAAAAAFEGHVATSTSPRKLERMHEILGLSAWYQDDFAGAIEHLSQANLTGNMYAKYYLARAHEAAGDAEEAAGLYDELAVYNFNGPGYAMFRKDIIARAGAG